MRIRQHVPLSPLTTFKIGGPAQYFADVHTEENLKDALVWAHEKNYHAHIIAGGSNILIPDNGLGGLTIRISSTDYDFANTTLSAQAGTSLLHVIEAAADEGLSGMERMAGIPGTVGGAIRGNAGAFGTEIKDVVTWVRALHRETNEVHEFSNAECAFGYRMSYFKKHPEWIILSAHFKLAPGKREDCVLDVRDVIKERERRHIQNVKAAGSFFMNPQVHEEVCELFQSQKGTPAREGRVPAGWLIDMAGMKGHRIGDAEVSPQQANYIRNVGQAKASDVLMLARKVKQKVRDEFHVELHEEAVIL